MKNLMKNNKLIIGMVHFPPLPGTPEFDDNLELTKIIESVTKDLEALQSNGIDAIMFGNEGDRPYTLKASDASLSAMAYVIGLVKKNIRVPFGVNYLWDPLATVALGCVTNADFAREVFTGVYDSDMGLWQPSASKALELRSNLRGTIMSDSMAINTPSPQKIEVSSNKLFSIFPGEEIRLFVKVSLNTVILDYNAIAIGNSLNFKENAVQFIKKEVFKYSFRKPFYFKEN